MNVICWIVGHRPMLTDSGFDPTPEQLEELDVVDLPTLWFTVESCRRCDRLIRAGVGRPGEQLELVDPVKARWKTIEAIERGIPSHARATPLRSRSGR